MYGVTMQITDICKDLETLLESYFGFEYHASCYDENLVFSVDHCPTDSVALDGQKSDQLIAFYYEEIRCYQLVLFKIEKLVSEPSWRAKVEILDITEIYKSTDTATPVKLLDRSLDHPIVISYSRPSECEGEQFCVELDLGSLRIEFPRLVERIADAIVFLGEVLLAGGKE